MSEEEKTERVARAMWDATERSIPVFNRRSFSQCPPIYRAMLVDMARAAITALKEEGQGDMGIPISGSHDTTDKATPACILGGFRGSQSTASEREPSPPIPETEKNDG